MTAPEAETAVFLKEIMPVPALLLHCGNYSGKKKSGSLFFPILPYLRMYSRYSAVVAGNSLITTHGLRRARASG